MDTEDLIRQFIIPDYANLTCDSMGLDSRAQCFDRAHFDLFGPVHYQFNSIGYRQPPPESFQGNEILVMGDSFTLGLGVNIQHTWPWVLQQQLHRPVIAFSLNGASNQWMARRLADLLRFFDPPAVIVHYSFSHRREHERSDWFDNERTLSDPSVSPAHDFDHWQAVSHAIHDLCDGRLLIESFITGWHQSAVTYHAGQIPPVDKIDLARDGFHYGVDTHRRLAQLVADRLTSLPACV